MRCKNIEEFRLNLVSRGAWTENKIGRKIISVIGIGTDNSPQNQIQKQETENDSVAEACVWCFHRLTKHLISTSSWTTFVSSGNECAKTGGPWDSSFHYWCVDVEIKIGIVPTPSRIFLMFSTNYFFLS